jgi:DNA-binding IclR family transcriptional regulator
VVEITPLIAKIFRWFTDNSRNSMKSKSQAVIAQTDTAKRSYAAPALDKGLDILEMLCASDHALQQKEIADQLGRSVGEIYRMLSCLVSRGYVAQLDDTSYTLTTKLFELAHINPPTQRLLFEATPIMQRLANELDQSCHLTIYSQGKQVVLAKVDTPSGMGFSVRAGSELEVLISVSGRVLVAFQSEELTAWRMEESAQNRPAKALKEMAATLKAIRTKGYESSPSVQVRGLHAISFPIVDTRGHAIAALTVPYSERIDQSKKKSIADVVKTLGLAAGQLSVRMGGPGRQ